MRILQDFFESLECRRHLSVSVPNVPHAHVSNLAAIVSKNSIHLSWEGTATSYVIERGGQQAGGYYTLPTPYATTNRHEFTDVGTDEFLGYDYIIVAQPYRGRADAIENAFGPYTQPITADPVSPVSVSPDPAAPLDGGIVTLRAVIRVPDAAIPDGAFVAWSDGTGSTHPADYSTYDTHDPLTRGVAVRHYFRDGGSYFATVEIRDSSDRLFDVYFPVITVPGRPPTIIRPAHVAARRGGLVTLSVDAVDPGGGIMIYDWYAISPSRFSRQPYSTVNGIDQTINVPIQGTGDFRFRVVVSTQGGLTTASEVVVHVPRAAAFTRVSAVERGRV